MDEKSTFGNAVGVNEKPFQWSNTACSAPSPNHMETSMVNRKKSINRFLPAVLRHSFSIYLTLFLY